MTMLPGGPVAWWRRVRRRQPSLGSQWSSLTPLALLNTCEGADAAAVTTINTAGPNQFTAVFTSGSGAVTFTASAQHRGQTGMAVTAVAGIGSTGYADYGGQPSDQQKYWSAYYEVAAFPTVNTRVVAFLGSATLRCALLILTTGVLRIVNAAAGTVGATTATVPLGQMVRIDFEVSAFDPATGLATVTARLASGANLEVAGAADSGGLISFATVLTSGLIDTVRTGISAGVVETVTFTAVYDDVQVTNTGTPAPLPADPMAGTAVAASTGDGALTQVMGMTGTAASATTGSGALVQTMAAAGTAVNTSTGQGTLGEIMTVAGTAVNTSTGAGTLAEVMAAAGTAVNTSTGAGGFAEAMGVTGTAVARSTGTGTLADVMAAFGTAVNITTGTGTLAGKAAVAGTAANTTTGQGSLAAKLAAFATAVNLSTGQGLLVPPPPGVASMIAGLPHGMWSAGPAHDAGYAARQPHGTWAVRAAHG